MNHKERRKMSKRLGILQYQQKLSRSRKFDLLRENIISGKQMHKENVERNRILHERLQDEKDSQKIYLKALEISEHERLPIETAIEKAKKEISEKK